MLFRSIRPQENKDLIIEEYCKNMLSPSDIANKHGFYRTGVKNFLANNGLIRSMSEASKLAVAQGKKDKAIAKLIISAKTTNRFNSQKSRPGRLNGRWIEDRTKLKNKRCIYEEKQFMKDVLAERDFTCQITGQRGGRLSVHHLYNFAQYPELRFEKSNVVVIKREIHMEFHHTYGTHNNTKEQFEEFVKTRKS